MIGTSALRQTRRSGRHASINSRLEVTMNVRTRPHALVSALIGSILVAGCEAPEADESTPADSENVTTRSSAVTNFVSMPLLTTTVPVLLLNRNSGKCLGVVGSSITDGAQIAQFGCDLVKSKAWFLIPSSGSSPTYQIRPGHTGWKAMDVPGGSQANGTLLQMATSVSGNQ